MLSYLSLSVLGVREEKAESDCLLREDIAELSYSDS